jgi:hypothetical protein
MERHTIRWSSALIEPIGDFYELRVELDEAPSEAWLDAVNETAIRQYREWRGRPWGMVCVWGHTLVVQDLEEGCEESLKAYLRELFEAADAAAQEKRQTPVDLTPEAERVRARHRMADKMAERFRSDRHTERRVSGPR